MSTRKIKDAKDLRDGSLIYFKGHAKATYMSDGSTVEDAINDIKDNGSGNSDLFDYETKVESQNKLQEAKDYTDTAIANLVDSAPETLNTLNELAVAIQENEDVVDALNQSIGSKQDTITDLEIIRQGAAKGATALLEHQDISSKADVYGNPNGIVVKEDNPQNSINIHPRGIIESESWKYNEAFSTEWIPYFLLSGNSLSLGSGVSTDDGFKIEAVLNIRTQDRSDEEFLRTSHTMILLYDERGNSKGTGLLLTDDFILLYAYNPESEIDISENMTELEVPFNDSIFDTRLRGIAEPVSNHDAVNKKYVDDNYVSVNNIKTINGQSLLGEGDIVISGGNNSSGGAYALVEHGTNDTTFTLTPNTFHTWGEVGSLTLILGEEQSGVANEFLFQFESGATATTLTLPADLIWANDDIPVIESNYTYQVSILKGFATLMKFKKAVLLEFTITIREGWTMIERNETYLYKTGMTWEQWVNSEYNTNGDYKIDDGGYIYNESVTDTMSGNSIIIYYQAGLDYIVTKSDFIDNTFDYLIL